MATFYITPILLLMHQSACVALSRDIHDTFSASLFEEAERQMPN